MERLDYRQCNTCNDVLLRESLSYTSPSKIKKNNGEKKGRIYLCNRCLRWNNLEKQSDIPEEILRKVFYGMQHCMCAMCNIQEEVPYNPKTSLVLCSKSNNHPIFLCRICFITINNLNKLKDERGISIVTFVNKYIVITGR